MTNPSKSPFQDPEDTFEEVPIGSHSGYSTPQHLNRNSHFSFEPNFGESPMPTPNIDGRGFDRGNTGGGNTGDNRGDRGSDRIGSGSNSSSRMTSLRFNLPESHTSSSATLTQSPERTLHSTPHSRYSPPDHLRILSPFSDQSIPENGMFNLPKPQSPFTQHTFQIPPVEEEYDFAQDEDLNRKGTVMKRHRWGTTRNKQGRPKKENQKKSHGLKRLLLTSGKANRSDSIRRPNTTEDIIDDYASDHNSTELTKEGETTSKKDPLDRKEQKRLITFNGPLPPQYLDEEGNPLADYPRNKIRTTKYTPLSFIPKNISNQFIHNIANVYFLFLNILGAFGIFGVPSPALAAVPLIVIVAITAVKDAMEDSRRTVTDMEVNNQITHILSQHTDNEVYTYVNYNVNDEKVSLWRRFKKWNSKQLFALIYKVQGITKEGRAKQAREEHLPDQGRKSFESAYMDETPRNSMDRKNPFNPEGESHQRTSFDKQRASYDKRSSYEGRQSLQRKRNSLQGSPRTLKYSRKYWKDVRVGDILRIYNNDELPADVVILATSDEDNCCYVETKNLDGETNLKVRQALKYGSVVNKINKADDLISHEFEIESEGPHPNLYSYQGNLKYGDQQEAITINNLLLRGCSLRNTKWVVAVVVFTGDDTKIMINAGITPTKQSRISRELNYYILMNFILLFVICFAAGLVNGIYYRRTGTSRDYFEFGTIASTPALNGLVDFFVALILYGSLVPISLYITIEIIKTAQVFFIYSDVAMYYEQLDYPCTPKSWSISDDLGQIEYIFSDKTGTLTQNLMEFKKCTINGVSYGRAYTEALAGLRKRQGVDVEAESSIEKALIAEDKIKMIAGLTKISKDTLYHDELSFISSEFVEDLDGAKGDLQKTSNEHFMLALALCHSVLVETDPKNPAKLALKAQSPDEAALVSTARAVGFDFKATTKKGVVVNVQGTPKEYQVLNSLEFNSTRKRMSAIIKIPAVKEGDVPKALLICKGADSIIYGRLSKTLNNRKLLDTTSKHLEQYATEGLRTLCIAHRELTWSQYLEWNARHEIAALSLDDREAAMEEVADSIERELILMGGTAIEDRLQDGVPDTIQLLADAGIKLWVLTGDKVETAINIGFSCNLLGNDMELLLIKTNLTPDEISEYNVTNYEDLLEPLLIDYLISHYLARFFSMTGSDEELEDAKSNHSPPNPNFGIVIDGDALKLALEDKDTRRKFLLLCKQCKAVLCCRVSPAQKASVVKLVKDTLDVMTLAIGDGSNDVAMIQAADVGVGIAGEEGRQAVMSSDYAVGQFRFLAKLLIVHGRWSYKRFSEMIPSFFYKNVIFVLALFWYGIFNDYDGTYLFEFTYLTFYNLAFSSLAVIFLGVFDQDVSAKASLLVPQIYRTGILRSEWTQKKFWFYMIDAVYQSGISFFFPYWLYHVGFIRSDGLALDHRFLIGIVVASISCITCNLYILMHQYRWDYLSVLFVSLSVLILFGWTGIWTSVVASQEFYNAAAEMYGATTFWACLFIGILVCLLPRLVFDFLQKLYWPYDIDIIRECELRGDFDAYPYDYDPTDPNRVKLSNYTKEYAAGEEYVGGSTTSTGSDDRTIGVDELQKQVDHVAPLPVQIKRKSVLDIFTRSSKIVSTYSESVIDSYHPQNRNSELAIDDIAMEVFDENQRAAKKASIEVKRISSQFGRS